MSVLADRIRGIVTPRAHGTGVVASSVVETSPVVGADPCVGPLRSPVVPAGGHAGPPLHDLPAILGGEWLRAAGGHDCFVVERRRDPVARYGRVIVGELAESLRQAAADAPLFAGGAPARPPFVFFDLETTGLSGGAGTHAFLVGCGWFDGDAFVTRQFVMTRYADERALLERVAGELARAGALVSFNGKSFDAPVLETRYLFHRLAWAGGGIPHIDALHPARRFWPGDCSLVALERQLIDARRAGDVAGFEIPARYFQFVRSGNPRPLVAVLEHNRLDLLTLAALTARLLHLARNGPSAARDGREAYALGLVYARAGLEARARECFARAVDMSAAPPGAFDPLRVESLRALAIGWRRARQWDEAAACWRQLLETRGCPPPLRREASEALAIHHEHRVRDLSAARGFALKTLEHELPPAWTEAVHHRLARIERKMSVGRLL
jgi:uncharacterized protein YprB with RNaseH-like and TPR domain